MMPYTLDNWNTLIGEINTLAASPENGCTTPGALPELTAPARWSKQNIKDAQNKLYSICPENTFAEIPERWEQSTIDELEAAIALGWCDCDEGPYETYTNNWVNGWPYYIEAPASNPAAITSFPTNRDPLDNCALTTWQTTAACGWRLFNSAPYTMTDDSGNIANAEGIESTYNEIEALLPIWEENRAWAKYWDNQADIAETPREVATAEDNRDAYQAVADAKSTEMDTFALANAVFCRALTGTTDNTPNLARPLYDQRSITLAFAYGNAFAIILSPWDTGIHPSTHTQATFEMWAKHSDEAENYIRYTGKCTPAGLPYIHAEAVMYEFEKLILYAAGDHLWTAISYHYRTEEFAGGPCAYGYGPCSWMTPPVTPPTEDDIVTTDIYLKILAGTFDA